MTQLNIDYLDSEGYPTEEFLELLKTYKPSDELPLIKFIKDVLRYGWYMEDWGFVLKKPYRGIQKLELHTGGWSGNEETIRALLSNIQFTHFKMRYVQWRTGGHYYFEIQIDQ